MKQRDQTKIATVVIYIVALMLVLIMPLLWSGEGYAQPATLVEVQQVTLSPGASGVVAVSVKNITAPTGLAAYNFTAGFSPQVILIDSVQPGDPPFNSVPTHNINNSAGSVRLLAVLSTLEGAKGNVIVARLAVRAVATAVSGATTALNLTISKDGLLDAQGNTIPASVSNGAVQILGTPKADFSASTTTTDAGNSVYFNDTSTGTPTSWLWDFGDGTTSSQQNPTKTYTKAGVYQVKLTVANSAGSNTKTIAITVEPGNAYTITVTPGTVTLGPGKTQQFSAVGKDQYGNEIPGLTLAWSVVGGGGSVDQTGRFTAGMSAGTFTNTVKASAFYKGGSPSGYATVFIVAPLKAEISIGEFIAQDGTVGIAVKINRLKDASSGETKLVPGGIGTHKIAVSYTSGELEVLSASGVTPFSATVNIQNAAGQTTVLAVSPTGTDAPPFNTAQLVVRIKWRANSPVTLSLNSDSILDAQKGEDIYQDSPVTYKVVRGDVQKVITGAGTVTTADALYLAQYLVGLRSPDEINLLNAASIRHDDSSGDRITTADLLYLTQYLVGLRDENFAPVS